MKSNFTWSQLSYEVYNIQSRKKGYTSPEFLIYVLACTAQTTKSMKTNDIPLKSPIKLQKEIPKFFSNFPKFVRFLGHFLKKQCFWKMGVAGIKQLPCPSKIASFSGNLNGEALLKDSFKILTGFRNTKLRSGKFSIFLLKLYFFNDFRLLSLVFLKPVLIFEWNFQEGFPIEIH